MCLSLDHGTFFSGNSCIPFPWSKTDPPVPPEEVSPLRLDPTLPSLSHSVHFPSTVLTRTVVLIVHVSGTPVFRVPNDPFSFSLIPTLQSHHTLLWSVLRPGPVHPETSDPLSPLKNSRVRTQGVGTRGRGEGRLVQSKQLLVPQIGSGSPNGSRRTQDRTVERPSS